jgi:hypothetical protein
VTGETNIGCKILRSVSFVLTIEISWGSFSMDVVGINTRNSFFDDFSWLFRITKPKICDAFNQKSHQAL